MDDKIFKSISAGTPALPPTSSPDGAHRTFSPQQSSPAPTGATYDWATRSMESDAPTFGNVTAPVGPRRSPMRTVREARNLLGVSSTTIRRLIRGGQLPAYRIGGQFRIAEADLRAWLAAQRYGGR